jgi:hypothetical protein
MICEVCDKEIVVKRTPIENFPMLVARCDKCALKGVAPKWVLVILLASLEPDNYLDENHDEMVEKSLSYFQYDRAHIIDLANQVRTEIQKPKLCV